LGFLVEKTWTKVNQGAQQLGFLLFDFLSEDGRRSSFRNLVILLKYIDDGQNKKNTFTDYNALSSETFRLHVTKCIALTFITCYVETAN
jgi:hypothetical protein